MRSWWRWLWPNIGHGLFDIGNQMSRGKMAQSRVGIGLGLLLCLLAFTLACSVTKSTSIGSISANPASYLGQKVTVSGEYRGWGSGYGSPPVLRSDWVLKDST